MKVLVAFIMSSIIMLVTCCDSDTTVLICESSGSYAFHSHKCSGLGNCRASIERISLSEAKSMGRRPCRYCYPKDVPQPPPVNSVREVQPPKMSTPPKTSTPPKSGSQCTAITKKGTRCSRRAKSSGLCWQHGR